MKRRTLGNVGSSSCVFSKLVVLVTSVLGSVRYGNAA
jgi:hypothetical protein